MVLYLKMNKKNILLSIIEMRLLKMIKGDLIKIKY